MDTGEELLNKPAIEAVKTRTTVEPPSGIKLDYSLLQDVGWNAAGDWGTQLFTWAMFLVVMRLLDA